MITYSGIGRYIENLLGEFSRLDRLNRYILFCSSKELDLSKYGENFSKVEIAVRVYGIREQIILPFELKREKLDLFHSPHYVIPFLYSGKLVVTIHDLIHLLFPQYLPSKIAYWYAKFMLKEALRKAKKVIAVSQNTKRDIIKFFPQTESKIRVIYEGVEEKFRPIREQELLLDFRHRYSLKGKFILYIGLKKPHKNLIRLIKAFARLKKETGIEHKLVFTDKKGMERYPEIFKTTGELNLGNEIRLIDYIPDKELPFLYNSADLFVLPSLYEGFGLPVLEAMACGCPVIASNTSSLPEVVGDAGILVDPYNVEELAEVMGRVLTDEELRRSMIEKGLKRSKLFSWERCARETLAVYEEAIKAGK